MEIDLPRPATSRYYRFHVTTKSNQKRRGVWRAGSPLSAKKALNRYFKNNKKVVVFKGDPTKLK